MGLHFIGANKDTNQPNVLMGDFGSQNLFMGISYFWLEIILGPLEDSFQPRIMKCAWVEVNI